MTESEDAARNVALAKLAQSREELRRLLDRPPKNSDGSQTPDIGPDAFPRSRIMQALMSGRGMGALGAIAGGVLIARPALAMRLLRLVPASAIGRVLMLRAFTALRAKHEQRQSSDPKS